MILTVFQSRLKEEAQEEYKTLVPHIVAEAEKMPGFLWRKSYVAEDGERLSLVAFEDEQSQYHWSQNAAHVAAQKRGRDAFYSEYTVQVCTVIRDAKFSAL
jgi:heme-degrading monooxygenase HmoA